MKALVFNALHQPLSLEEISVPQPANGEVLVQLHAAALNHRDIFITQGLYGHIKMPCILGADGAGEYAGQPVVMYPALAWGEDAAAQGRDFRVLGMPEDGTFAAYLRIPAENLYPKPVHLTWEQAAALPLAGLTAWRALFTRCALRAGEKVLITGIGGGVALTALQLAVAAGAEVWVTSGSEDKITHAIGLGAKGGTNYQQAGWDKQLKKETGGFDIVIDSAAGDGFAALLGLCNPGGRIGIYGGTLGKMNDLSPQLLFWKQISILGSTMGTHADFSAMLDFVTQHKIVPIVDTVFPLEEGNAAMARLASGEQFGKVVLKM